MKIITFAAAIGLALSFSAIEGFAADKTCIDAMETVSGEEQRVTGSVKSIHDDAEAPGVCKDSVYIKVTTPEGERTVFLAPRDYLGASKGLFKTGQEVDIIGVQQTIDGATIIVAGDIIKPSSQVLSLRDDQGRALWMVQASADKAGKQATAKETATREAAANAGKDKKPEVGATGQRGEGEQQKSANRISIPAGHNVVDAVDDVRETTADLANAIIDAKGMISPENSEKLRSLLRNLDEMEQQLDSKADATDSSWLNWMADRDYSVTVKGEIEKLGKAHGEMAQILSGATKGTSLDVVVGHNLVDQVDDARETVADLIHALNDAGPQLGWFDDSTLFKEHLSKLNEMEKVLDQKAEATDENLDFFSTQEFSVMVHGQIGTLAEVLNDLSSRIAVPQK